MQTTITHKYCKLQIVTISQIPSWTQSQINIVNYKSTQSHIIIENCKSPKSHVNDANRIIVIITHKCSTQMFTFCLFLRVIIGCVMTSWDIQTI
jgi:hypothetical protein